MKQACDTRWRVAHTLSSGTCGAGAIFAGAEVSSLRVCVLPILYRQDLTVLSQSAGEAYVEVSLLRVGVLPILYRQDLRCHQLHVLMSVDGHSRTSAWVPASKAIQNYITGEAHIDMVDSSSHHQELLYLFSLGKSQPRIRATKNVPTCLSIVGSYTIATSQNSRHDIQAGIVRGHCILIVVLSRKPLYYSRRITYQDHNLQEKHR